MKLVQLMFEDLENDSRLESDAKVEESSLAFIRDNLSNLAPDYVEFIEKFGRANINNCGFVVYGWTRDLADFFVETLELERPDVDAWLIGDDFSGDYAGVNKKNGKIIEVSIENCEAYDEGAESFSEFIRRFINYGGEN